MFRFVMCVLCATAFAMPAAAQSAKPSAKETPDKLSGGPRPQISARVPPTISFRSKYAPGTILIDTKRRRLLYVRSRSRAYLYPITVGRLGFQWTGTKRISAKRNWPDWRPPAKMRERKPNLPKLMTGGLYNPLGAKALYLGSSLYRIHGTNNAKSIGQAASSGCFRMHNTHVAHLAKIAKVGTKVVVMNALPSRLARSFAKQPDQQITSTQRRRSEPRRRAAPRKRSLAWRRAILGLN